jgi:hypothetical protein
MTRVPTDVEPWLTKRELAGRLQVSVRTIERQRIPCIRVGGQNRYFESEVRAFLRGELQRGELILLRGGSEAA